MPRRAWLLPGRRQAIFLALLILLAGGCLLLLPDRSRSYRAVATATAPTGAPDCVQAASDHVGDATVRELAARRARIRETEVAGATEVVAAPAGAVLAVAFEADTAYAAQRGARWTAWGSVGNACDEEGAERFLALAVADERLADAVEALEAAPPPPPPSLVTARDEAARRAQLAARDLEQVSTLRDESVSVAPAEALGSDRSGLQELAVPAGAAACALLAVVILRTGWRRTAVPVPA